MMAADDISAVQVAVAVCGCGASYTAAQWGELRYVGPQLIGDGGPDLILRDCAACNSTLGVWVNTAGQLCDENGRPL